MNVKELHDGGDHAQNVTMVEDTLFKREEFPIENGENSRGGEKGKSSLEIRKMKQESI